MTLIRKGMHISTIFINLLLLVMFLSFLSRKIEAQQPSYQYLNHSCPDTTTFPVYATYRANRDSVLSWLSSNASSRDGFYNTTAGSSPDIVYGLFLCRGDVSASVCQECVSFAADDLSRLCPVQKTALLWYDVCLIRFSNQNIFSVLADEPAVPFFTSRNATVEHRFHQLVTVVMNDAANQVANEPRGAKKFATRVANYSRFQTLYALVQCTPDLSGTDCKRCLQGAIANLSDCCSGKSGARILKPSCNVRHQTFLFYDPTIGEDKQNKSNWITVVVASLSATIGLAVVSVFGFFIRRRINSQEDRDNNQEFQLQHSRETLRGENMGNSEEFPSIQLDILHAATNHFSNENKLGEGGFGPVYKGILADGKQIAVKRLSTTSSQGLVEFKNEVVLIARLQHKNLVRLIGCCLEKKEKLLVYEFMSNGSLDAVLFDSILNEPLDWLKRFSIIKGIARGIMYLHEDSRLRVIHRDLKASNVLLDHNMNPKISDFGMARIFGEDKNEAKTRRVVGTYGYMAPEYAMRGLFSIKSDVFSFGVIFLEIMSGKKNNSFLDPEGGESLLTFAWNLWSKGEGMELIDPVLVPSCVASEVLKCHSYWAIVRAKRSSRQTNHVICDFHVGK